MTTIRNWFFGAPLVCALVPLVFLPTLEWIAVAPHGRDEVLGFGVPFVPLTLIAICALLIELVRLAVRRRKPNSTLVAKCSAAYLVAFVFAAPLGKSVRMSAFHRLAERSKPLIAAIHAYEQKTGRPPESLQALVPELMPFVPTTGIGASPQYQYSTVKYADHPSTWTIKVPVSRGLSFDEFVYSPETIYSEAQRGERVGDWVYLRD